MSEALRLVPADEFATAVSADELVDGMIVKGGLCMLFGPSGSGKSFVALDLAAAVASGRLFLGRPTEQGRAVYVAAEGVGGLRKRVQAWKDVNGLRPGELSRLEFIEQAIDLTSDTEVTGLIDAISVGPPVALVVIDTFAQCFSRDENNHEITTAIHAIQRLQQETGAAVLLVHHATKANDRTERGSSRLKAAMDTVMSLTAKDGLRLLEATKQKDLEPFPTVHLTLKRVELGQDHKGRAISSAVVSQSLGPETTPRFDSSRLSDLDVAVLRSLESSRHPLKSGEWQQKATDPATNGRPTRDVFQKSRRRLMDRGWVRNVGQARYKITDEGRQMCQESAIAESRHGTQS